MLARCARIVATPVALLALIAVLAPSSALGAGKTGVLAGSAPLRGMNVVLYAATPGAQRPTVLGSTRSRTGGGFTLRYSSGGTAAVKYLVATRPGGGAEAGFAVPGGTYRLAAALGAGRVPRRASVNERTTVAIGYAMAQFIDGGRVAGKDPGLSNAAAMTANLVRVRNGGLSRVLATFPNGRSTSALRSFDSLANLLSVCRLQSQRCANLLALASVPGGSPAADTLAATVAMARYPWHHSRALFELSLPARGLFRPALAPGERPDAWTLALRFEGDPPGLDGPGNFAIDAEGNLWVGNNYEYSRESTDPTCFGRTLFRFTPTGEYYPGSPYESGGTSGVGFGVTIDPSDHVWVGNFGFAGHGCDEQPPSNSVSEYTLSGEALSPALEESGEIEPEPGVKLKTYKGGWEVGEMFWPQGIVSDTGGNIWTANCGNNSVTRIDSVAGLPPGTKPTATNYPGSSIEVSSPLPGKGFGFSRPFGIAINGRDQVYVTANDSATVVALGANGEVLHRIEGGGLHRPLGIASDSRGNMWVGNSTWVVAPCVGEIHPQGGPKAGGSVTLIKSNGELAKKNPYRGGGLENAWGVAVDGDDNVWVANFSGRRLSELCGMRTENCPIGKRRVGASISPPKTGYGFDGLVRNTGVAVDPSGNVWLANNWKHVPIQTNPGGYQIVAYLGLAAPVKTPIFGPPERP